MLTRVRSLAAIGLTVWAIEGSVSGGEAQPGHESKPDRAAQVHPPGTPRHAHPSARPYGERSGGRVRITMEELHRHGGVPPGWRLRIPPGDPNAGREAFVKLECFKCHEVTGERVPGTTKGTGDVGPELTGMGRHHPAECFAESILDPNAVIVTGPGYAGPDGLSIMPDYRESLTVDEMIDLVAYLRSLDAPVLIPARITRRRSASGSSASFVCDSNTRPAPSNRRRDVNNVYVTCHNLGLDPSAYLDALPAGAVAEIHLAGHSASDADGRTVLIDDHGSRVAEPVWRLLLGPGFHRGAPRTPSVSPA